MTPRLHGIFVAVGTRGRFLWEEASPVFTRQGMVCKDVGNAAQMAWFPLRHIVEEVVGGFCEGWFEDLLLPANGEPLGPPVHGFLPEALPFTLGVTLLLDYEMGAEDARGVRRAKPQSDLGEFIGTFIADDALVAWCEADGERLMLVACKAPGLLWLGPGLTLGIDKGELCGAPRHLICFLW